MEMFADNDQVAKLQTRLASVHCRHDIADMVELAWHLRQRDTRQALQLAEDAKQCLQQNPVPELLARIQLIEGEAKWLFAELAPAQELTSAAMVTFEQQQNHRGMADCWWLNAVIALDQGRHMEADLALEEAASHARSADDMRRLDLIEATLARWAVFRDPVAAINHWEGRFPHDCDGIAPEVAAWILDFHALAAAQLSDFATSIEYGIECLKAAEDSGQLRLAIITCTNTGEAFFRLNDHQSALEWMQRGLELARPTEWPRSIGACLMHTAEAMRHLNQFAVAQQLLEQALVTLTPLANARPYAISLQYLGNLALDQHDYPLALSAFERLQQRADALAQSDFQIDSRRGQAHALSHLGQAQAALTCAHAALTIAREQRDTFRQITVLQVLSGIHARHDLPAEPSESGPARPALNYLLEAIQVAATIDGYTIPGEILDALAQEYAKSGAFEKAYDSALQAHQAWKKIHNQDATNRAIALQVKHQTERAHAESQYLRQLAIVEAQRAAASQQNSDLLSHLSTIGQEITTHLTTSAVFAALDRHVLGLLEVSSLAVYMLEDHGQTLVRVWCHEGEQLLPQDVIDFHDPVSRTAYCARERRELTVHYASEDDDTNLIPGTLPTLSALFSPLIVGERLLGVISIQSLRAHAYGEHEWLIFRTLCAYGAIALDNADAYRQLQEAQAQLVEQEKMAALGSLVAGVAHELNTPIGNSLVIASTLQDKSNVISAKIQGPGMKRSDLTNFIEDTRHASTLIQRGLHNAVDLLQSFKQVAVDRTTASRRQFDLHQTSVEIVATMMNQIRKSGHTLAIDIAPGIVLNSYPGPLGQVLTNLINNALLHAFEERENGQMRLLGWVNAPGQVCIEFSDNGNGIDSANLYRIFDPFFTTKLGRGGSGLGLSISYNITTSLLQGNIKVQSTPGSGTTFTLELPLEAPDKTEPMAHMQAAQGQ
jgi:signal transduction histidine kinase